MDLFYRLKLFLDNDQICNENFEAMKRVISMLGIKWNIKLTEENGAMFITHLTMAYERIKQGNAIQTIEPIAYNEILQNRNIDKSKRALEDIMKEINTEMPDSEIQFILLYLCTIFENV
jgi:transcriptional regulatory protein LevR